MEKPSVSTIIRKPWGGQLDLEKAPVPEGRRRGGGGPRLSGLMLRKFTELSLLSILVAVPLMYQFSLPGEGILALREWFGLEGAGPARQAFILEHLEPYLTGMLPTLESKFSVWFVLGVITIAGYVAMRFYEGITQRSLYDNTCDLMAGTRRAPHRFVPLVMITLFLAWGLASILLWPPGMPPEAAALMGGAGPEMEGASAWIADNLGGGGFFYSMTAWAQIVFAFIFFLVCEDLIRDRRFVGKILILIVTMGFLNALTVLLLKVEFEPLMNIWTRFSENDARNRLGAFIGHNTGVASFLMAPLFISLVWIVVIKPRRDQWLRIFLVMAVLMMALAMLLTQSRAVVPITIGLNVFLFWLLFQRSCLLPHSRLYIWFPVALIFVMMTQLLPLKINPLYREDVTLVQRAGEFRPERLLTETRLRIVVVSLSRLFPEAPFLGHGFGSFQYVYPKAQGEYFMANPRSRLAPTPLRTQRAHNEYLQTLVETGVVGLGLLLIGVFFLLRGGWRVMRRTLMPHHTGIQAAVFCSIVALLLHCVVDFPLRVPPLAMTLVFLLAIWSACDRLWLFPMLPPSEDADPIPNVEDPENPNPTPTPRRPSGGLSIAAATVLLAVALAGAVSILGVLFNRFQTSAVLAFRGDQLLKAYQDNPGSRGFLLEGTADVKAARRVFWASGTNHRLNAYANYLQSRFQYQVADQISRDGDYEKAGKAREYAEAMAGAAIKDINLALSDERFDKMYLLRHSVKASIAANSTGEKREVLQEDALLDLYRAVEMNIGDSSAIYTLITKLEEDYRANYTEIIRYLGILHHFHEGYFQERIFGRVLDGLSVAENQDAYDKMRMIAEAVPNDLLYRQVLGTTALNANDLVYAREVANSILENTADTPAQRPARENAHMLLTGVAIKQGDYELALRMIDEAGSFESVQPSDLVALHLYALQNAGGPEAELKQLRSRIEYLGQENPLHYQIAGIVAYQTFGMPGEAIYWLEKRLDVRKGIPPMNLQGRVILARSYAAVGEWDKLEDLLPTIPRAESSPYERRLAEHIVYTLNQRLQAARAESSGEANGE